MAKKRFCDICGKDISNDVIFELGIFDADLEEYQLERDMCHKCKNKINKLIEDANNKIRKI